MYWERPTTWTFAVMFTGLISKKMDTISFYRHTLVEQGTKFAVLSTNAALLRDLSNIKFGVILATVTPIGVKFCIMVHISPGQSSPLSGLPPGIPKIQKLWPSKKPISRTW